MRKMGVLAASASLLMLTAGCQTPATEQPLSRSHYQQVIELFANAAIPQEQRENLAWVLGSQLERDPDPVGIEALVLSSEDNRRVGPFRDSASNPFGNDKSEGWVGWTVGGLCQQALGRIIHNDGRNGFMWRKYESSWKKWWEANMDRSPEDWRKEVRRFVQEEKEQSGR